MQHFSMSILGGLDGVKERGNGQDNNTRVEVHIPCSRHHDECIWPHLPDRPGAMGRLDRLPVQPGSAGIQGVKCSPPWSRYKFILSVQANIMGQCEDRGSDGVHHQCSVDDSHPLGLVLLGSAWDRLDVLRCDEWFRYSIQLLLLQRIDE